PCFTLFPYTTLFRSSGRVIIRFVPFTIQPFILQSNSGLGIVASQTPFAKARSARLYLPFIASRQSRVGLGNGGCGYSGTSSFSGDRKSTRLNSSHVK